MTDLSRLQHEGAPGSWEAITQRALSFLHELLPIFLPPSPYPGLSIQPSRPGTQNPPASASKWGTTGMCPTPSIFCTLLIRIWRPACHPRLPTMKLQGPHTPRTTLNPRALEIIHPSLSFFGVSVLPPSFKSGPGSTWLGQSWAFLEALMYGIFLLRPGMAWGQGPGGAVNSSHCAVLRSSGPKLLCTWSLCP